MKIYNGKVNLESKNQIEFMDITDKIHEIIDNSGIREGQVVVFSSHTTMGVVINHNETMLMQDFMRVLYRIVPVEDHYSHDLFELRNSTVRSDGRSNGHSHAKAMLIGSSETIPISKGKMMLGHRQSIFAVEFDGSRKRDITIQVIGE
ncbi:MAG: secondary thiamine-phosphate synthase enzyme YjbQ [Candidatus Moranbacteria bacterium]|jgi:secondary thiamine-phosphate synthase enzyme|nr:secondary thiamine-phosphate synthase enzyme YjbQ [Candidatus Moranbacteria bacterium]NCA93807.1 YjbQ family protein [Sphingobacteriia bacterium]NCU31738.1 YjbQ family protein [Candidatus Moranbacteria bacterium]NLC31373.1 YjbQ family protein [Candidatus Moranbacteria bacterium]